MSVKLSLVSALAVASMAASAHAAIMIDTLGSWDGLKFVEPFGGSGVGSTGVYGETFVAPSNAINSFTFEVNDLGTQLNGVYAQVYAWNGPLLGGAVTAQGATGPALFSSGPMTINGQLGFQSITINTGSTPLLQGQNYVILLTDTSSDHGAAEFGLVNGVNISNNGGMNFFNNNWTLDSIATNNWVDVNFGSMAFSATFAASHTGGIPEPATWVFMLLGIGAIGFAARRGRPVPAC